MSKSDPSVAFYLSQVLDNMGEAVIVTNLDSVILRFNKAAEDIYGWDSTDVVGKRISDIIPTKYLNISLDEVEKAFKETGTWTGEVIQQTKDGRELFIASNVTRFSNAEDKAIGIVAINHNITEQKLGQFSLEKSEALWRAFANALPDLAFVFDEQGRYVQILATQDDLLFYDKDKLLHNSVHNVLPCDIAELFLDTIQRTIETGESQKVEYVLDLKRGETWFEARTSCLQPSHDTQPLAIWLTRDITERRQLEMQQLELERLKINYESEQEVSHFRSQLLTTVSHEFRTPLAVIQTNTSMLERHLESMSEEKRLSRFERIETQLRYLKEMLDDVTNAIQTMNQEIIISPTFSDIVELCTELVEFLAAESDVKRVKIEHRGASEIFTDEWMLKLILSHLLSNALRYSPTDTEIRCIINCDDSYLNIDIVDYGMGIPDDEQDYIFEAHFRGNNTGTVRGIGLGLTIANNLALQLGGKISFESQLGEGSRFTVHLPLLYPEQELRED